MPLAIVGAGDHARVVAEGLRALDRAPAGFVQVGPPGAPAAAGLPLLGHLDDDAWVTAHAIRAFVVALGDNRTRADAFERCLALGLEPERMVHPTAIVLGGAEIGPGSQVCAGAVVGVDARVGANVIINTLASIDHDGLLGDHAFVGPGAHLAGRVRVDTGARIGIGASVREGTRIGQWATVAGGAMALRDVPPGVRVAGVPARPMDDPPQSTETG